MGRKHQEEATGLTYEERVQRAQGPLKRLYRYAKRRFGKGPPTQYANVRRDGVAGVNPNLAKRGQEEIE